MNKTMKDIINEFKSGAEEGISGNKSNPGNLKIKKNQVIHFATPILERTQRDCLLNMTRYSIQTGRLQKLINELMDNEKLKIVLRVPMDYKGSLLDFIEK